MSLYMFMGRYTKDAIKEIITSGSDREAAARAAIEAAGGNLIGFYGMFGQEYNIVIIADMPGTAEYIGAVAPVIGSGVFEAYKTIPLYTASDVIKGSEVAKNVLAVYQPPGSS